MLVFVLVLLTGFFREQGSARCIQCSLCPDGSDHSHRIVNKCKRDFGNAHHGRLCWPDNTRLFRSHTVPEQTATEHPGGYIMLTIIPSLCMCLFLIVTCN